MLCDADALGAECGQMVAAGAPPELSIDDVAELLYTVDDDGSAVVTFVARGDAASVSVSLSSNLCKKLGRALLPSRREFSRN